MRILAYIDFYACSGIFMTTTAGQHAFSPTEWQHFCEVMLRYHYGARNFHPVPDQDGGDLGIEFLQQMERSFSVIIQSLE